MTRRDRRSRGCARVTAAVAAAVLLAGCQSGDGPRQAPELEGTDLDGQQRSISDLAGDVVIVNAWASWCGPCREEMPVLSAAQDELGDDGLHVLGLNVRDRPEAAMELVEETGVEFPSIVDAEGTVAVEWGVRAMPQTFVVDRDGLIAAHRFGAIDEEWIETTVVPLVREGEE